MPSPLDRYSDMKERLINENFIFMFIVFLGEREAMQASIEMDRALVNSRNPLLDVPLHYTIDPDIAGDLLHNQAKPNEPNKRGHVGLHNMRNPGKR